MLETSRLYQIPESGVSPGIEAAGAAKSPDGLVY